MDRVLKQSKHDNMLVNGFQDLQIHPSFSPASKATVVLTPHCIHTASLKHSFCLLVRNSLSWGRNPVRTCCNHTQLPDTLPLGLGLWAGCHLFIVWRWPKLQELCPAWGYPPCKKIEHVRAVQQAPGCRKAKPAGSSLPVSLFCCL